MLKVVLNSVCLLGCEMSRVDSVVFMLFWWLMLIWFRVLMVLIVCEGVSGMLVLCSSCMKCVMLCVSIGSCIGMVVCMFYFGSVGVVSNCLMVDILMCVRLFWYLSSMFSVFCMDCGFSFVMFSVVNV